MQAGFQDGKGIELSQDRERKMLSLTTRQAAGFIDGRTEKGQGTDQRYHAGGISRWTGDRVVTGQEKKNAQLTKDTVQVGFQDGQVIE
jgi:hypothetical protein